MEEEAAKQDALFVNLILIFKNAAMQQMGKIMNPLTGKVERNLDQARFSIDTLEMLKDKTRGNLPEELERLLDSTLLELRMNYVEEAEAKAEAGDKGEAGAGTAEEPESDAGTEDRSATDEKPESGADDGAAEGAEGEGESKQRPAGEGGA